MEQIVILKFGGKLLETPPQIKRAAEYIVSVRQRGEFPVVVVSAIGETTDNFIALAQEVADHPDGREMDMLLSVGERMSIALLAMAINSDGRYRAVSYTGSQVGIITDCNHTSARIIEVKGYRLQAEIAAGRIPIIAGFQGISTDKEITTLGRGGSDATAVALAVALKAVRCELVKDTGGIFTADPKAVPSAHRIEQLDYRTLNDLSAGGAKVVNPRAAELASENNVTLSINGMDGRPGTLVSDRVVSKPSVTAVTLEENLLLLPFGQVGNGTERIKALFTGAGVPLAVVQPGSNGEFGRRVSLLTLVGWGGAIPPKAYGAFIEAIRKTSVEPEGIIGYGGRLTAIIPAEQGKTVLREMHERCLRLELFHPSDVGMASDS